MDFQARFERSSALADYFRAVADLGAKDEPTRQAIARLITGSASLMEASAAISPPAPDPSPDEPPVPEPAVKKEELPHFLEPAENTVEALGSELVEIEPDDDEDSAAATGSADLLPPLVQDRTAPAALRYTPLFQPQSQRAILSQALSATVNSAEPDLEEIVRRIGRAVPLDRLPMKPIRTLSRGVQLLIDLGAGMEPFAVDRARIGREILSLTGNVERLRFRGSPLDGVMGEGMFQSRPWQPPQPGVPILVVSDLGMNRWSPRVVPGSVGRWIEFSRAANEAGCPVLALVPLDQADWLPALERRISMIPWDRKTSARGSRQGAAAHPQDRTRHVHGGAKDLLPLKQALSLAVRVEPELIRAMRVELFPALGVSAEARLWEDPDVETRNAMGLVFRTDRRRHLQSELAKDPGRFEAAWKVIEPLHRKISPAIRMEEELAYASLSTAAGTTGEAARTTRSIVATLVHGQRETFSRWALHAALRMPDALKATREGIQLQQGIAARNPDLAAGLLAELPEKDRQIPAWLRPSDTTDSIQVGVRLVNGGFEIGPTSLPGSHPLSMPKMRAPWLDLAPVPESQTAPPLFKRVHFKLPEGGRFLAPSATGFILRTPSGQRFRLARKKRRAMIVCCDKFEEYHFEPLSGWSPHIDALARVLKDPEGAGFETCETFRNSDTRKLEYELGNFYSRLEPEDSSLLILGNAIASDNEGEPLLIGIDSSLDDEPMRMIPIHRLKEMIAKSPAASHAVIIDCLTVEVKGSGSIGGDGWSPLQSHHADEWLLRRRPGGGFKRAIKSVFKPDPFPEALIDALRLGESDTNQDGRISMSELREFVQRRLFEEKSSSDSFESHSSGDKFRMAKASVCGLACDIYVSGPALKPNGQPNGQPNDPLETVPAFLQLLRTRLDETIGRPDSVKIRMSANTHPNEIVDEISSSGVYLVFLTSENIHSKWLQVEAGEFSEQASRANLEEPRIFCYTTDPPSNTVLRFPGDSSIHVKPLFPEKLEEEAAAAAAAIAATLATIRSRLRSSDVA